MWAARLEAGRAPYARYCAVVQRRPYDGALPPPFDSLPTLEKLGWAAAGENPTSIDDTAPSCRDVAKPA